MHVEWSDRPRTLKDFPEATQTRLKQLEPNRVIAINVTGGSTLYVKRTGLNKFHCGVESSAMPERAAVLAATA